VKRGCKRKVVKEEWRKKSGERKVAKEKLREKSCEGKKWRKSIGSSHGRKAHMLFLETQKQQGMSLRREKTRSS
jgi:hypothetical protein